MNCCYDFWWFDDSINWIQWLPSFYESNIILLSKRDDDFDETSMRHQLIMAVWWLNDARLWLVWLISFHQSKITLLSLIVDDFIINWNDIIFEDQMIQELIVMINWFWFIENHSAFIKNCRNVNQVTHYVLNDPFFP